jgi:protein O-mannosyl-transferase
MTEEQIPASQPHLPELRGGFRYFPFFNRYQPVFALVVLGIVFYCTSLYNESALDDGILIHQNEYVLKGVRGIPDILTSDVCRSFYKHMCATDQLAGGRYRPLSVISFALEQQMIQPYRTGLYMKAEDSNHDGKLNHGRVSYSNSCGEKENNYEYNYYTDLNKDGEAQPNECHGCWDRNRNFKNDAEEDLNRDGVFNEVDCQVYGAHFRHFNNIWLYVLACVLLYLLFRNHFFSQNADLAFLAALIFLAHPVHSEVVANVRGRDDIFSVIFISLTFIFGFKFVKTKRWVHLILASAMFLFALLSKEYGLALLLVAPLAFHAFTTESLNMKKILLLGSVFLIVALSMIGYEFRKDAGDVSTLILGICSLVIFSVILCAVFFRSFSARNFFTLMACFFWVTLFYLVLRTYSVKMGVVSSDSEILNNPFALASGEEAFATKIFVLFRYLALAVFPHPLVSDYSYNTIPYKVFSDWEFILAAVLNLALLAGGIWLTVKRHVLGFAIMCYFIFLLATGNFIIGSGVLMLEANLFHATVGVAILFAWLLLRGTDLLKLNLNTRRTLLLSFVSVVLFVYGCKTWERNFDWKNDVTLFLKDVHNAPNSVLVLGNAGARWIDLADTKEITGINVPGQDSTRYNDYNGTLKITEEELKLKGYKDKREAALYRGIGYLQHAVELHPGYVNGYLNLGLAFFKLKKDYEAIYYWKMAERLYPNNPYLRNYYHVYVNLLRARGSEAFTRGDYRASVIEYNKAVIVQPDNAESWYDLGGSYFNLGNHSKAKECWEKTLSLDPGHKEAAKLLEMSPKGVTK